MRDDGRRRRNLSRGSSDRWKDQDTSKGRMYVTGQVCWSGNAIMQSECLISCQTPSVYSARPLALSIMHRLFAIYEVCMHFIEYIDRPTVSGSVPDVESLIQLALTNKAFLDPCMSVIWRDLRTLEAIFHTLPRELPWNMAVSKNSVSISKLQTLHFPLNDLPVV